MIIYILKHSNSDFSGTLCGVGFDQGRGSTSSTFDRDRCIKKGCKEITNQWNASVAAKKKKEEGKAAKAQKAEDLKTKKAEEKAMIEAEKEEEPEEEKTEEPEKEKE